MLTLPHPSPFPQLPHCEHLLDCAAELFPLSLPVWLAAHVILYYVKSVSYLPIAFLLGYM